MSLIVAAALLLQDPSAEETYKRIEETFRKAKTVTLTWTWEVKPWASKVWEGSGTLLLKNGGKANLSLKFENPAGEHKLHLVSDGSTLKYTYEPPDRNHLKIVHEATPKDLMDDLGIVRFGPFEGTQYAGVMDIYPRGGELDRFVRGSLKLTAFTPGDEEKGAKILTYKISCYRVEQVEVKLWYDALSHKPLKRQIRNEFWPVGGGNGKTRTESIEQFTLDADIPDEKFALPAEKPDPAVYRATDIGEPKGLALKSARDIRLVGWLEHGTLEYEGTGPLVDVLEDYRLGLKERGWAVVSERIGAATGALTLKKFRRVLTIEFSRDGDALRATLKVEQGK